MGAWGDGPFDNDDAADWSAEFEGVSAEAGLSLIDDALPAAHVPADDYLESDADSRAVATAELLTFVLGRPGAATAYNETPLRWIESTQPQASSSAVDRALAALTRVSSVNSELAELWDEAGREWRASIAELRGRLSA
jgi:hypothetical protein